MTKIVLSRPPKTDDELYELVKALWGVTIPRHKVCPDHVAPFEVFADAYFRRGPSISLWLGSRGLSGKCRRSVDIITLSDGTRVTYGSLIGQARQVLTPSGVAMATFTDNGVEPVYQITTDSGHQATVTGHHKFWTAEKVIKHKQPQPLVNGFVEADSIVKGDLVAIADHLKVKGAVSDPEYGTALGLMLGDGSTRSRTPVFTDVDGAEAAILRKSVESLGDELHHRTSGNSWGVTGGNLKRLMKRDSLFGLKSEHKFIPEWVFQSDDETRSNVLAGLLSTDGYFNDKQVVFSSASERLRDDISLLGLTLGVGGTKRVKENRGYKKDGVKHDCLDSYEWNVRTKDFEKLREVLPTWSRQPPTVRPNHKWREKNSREGFHWENVVNVELLPPTPTVCVSVHSDDHEYVTPFLEHNSFLLSILGLTIAFVTGSDVNLLGGSLAQSTNIHEHMRAALDYKNAPRYMIESEGNYLMKLTNGARIRPLTASQKTVRGPHPAVLLCDEIDEMDQDILDAALGQPMPQKNYAGEIIKPYTVLVSTHQHANGTVTEMKKRWEEQGREAKLWCYHDSANGIDGWLDEETITRKREEIPAEMFRVEYDLGEPSIGNRAFDSDLVKEMFSLPVDSISEKHKERFEEYTFSEPEKDGVYIVSADWAKEQDYTVIVVLRVDRQPHQLAYYLRVNRRPYPMMIKWFNDAIERYNAEAIHDATGLGNVVNDYIDTRARKFIMSGEKRYNMLTEYVGAVERGYFKLPKIPSLYSSHLFCRTGDLYSGATKDYHLPDEVCSMALAWNAARKHSGYGDPVTVQKKGGMTKTELHFANTSGDWESVITPMYEVEVKTKGQDTGISLIV